MRDLIIRAQEFAREKHAAQLRQFTGEPYFVHLEEVAVMVERAGLSENAIAAAFLHDIVEDQPVTIAEITSTFGLDIGMIVAALTDTPASPGLNRERRKRMDAARLAIASWETQSIKCADLISNTSSIVQHDPGFAKLYLKEKRAILEVLTRAHDGLRQQAWASLQKAEQALLQNSPSTPEVR